MCMAHFGIGQGSALSGILWYNNDGTVAFPTVLVGTGYAEGPGPVVDALPVAETVYGTSSGWSTLEFPQPMACSQEGFYMVFEFPAGHEFAALGAGGGAAIGYMSGEIGVSGWLSGDGESWMPLKADYRYAVLPQLCPVEPGMQVMNIGESFQLIEGSGDDESELPTQVQLSAGPNPFNPSIELQFSVVQASPVEILVFDIKGALVKRLVNETYPAGYHTVAWHGTDSNGRQVSSGAYFIRMRAGEVSMVQRVMLVR